MSETDHDNNERPIYDYMSWLVDIRIQYKEHENWDTGCNPQNNLLNLMIPVNWWVSLFRKRMNELFGGWIRVFYTAFKWRMYLLAGKDYHKLLQLLSTPVWYSNNALVESSNASQVEHHLVLWITTDQKYTRLNHIHKHHIHHTTLSSHRTESHSQTSHPSHHTVITFTITTSNSTQIEKHNTTDTRLKSHPLIPHQTCIKQ